MNGTKLELKNLSVRFNTYTGTVHAVRDLSFSLFDGECLAVVGESGCGKSTLALAIMGLIQTPPGDVVSGELTVSGSSFDMKDKKEMSLLRGREIGMIFQEPMTALNPTMTVGDQVGEALRRNLHLDKREIRERTVRLFEKVGIPDPERRLVSFPHELSGGMRQRIVTAIAIACDPRIIIADEPTTALDVTIQAQILDLLNELRTKSGSSLILITHNLGIVAQNAERVLIMYAGEIVEKAPVRELFNMPLHPYTRSLIAAVPTLDEIPKGTLPAIEGTPPDLIDIPEGCPFEPRCPLVLPVCRSVTPKWKVIGERGVRCHRWRNP